MNADPADPISSGPKGGPQDTPGRPATSSALRSAASLLLPGIGLRGAAISTGAVHWLIPAGLAMGLIYVGLYRASWRVFGEVAGVRLMPAAAVWLLDATLFGLVMLLGAARTADHWPNPAAITIPDQRPTLGQIGLIALFVLLILKLILWISIPLGVSGWPADWRRHLNFAYPRPVLRPLLLAPIWGRWGLMLAASVGRTAPAHKAALAGLGGACSPAVVLGWFVPVLALTAIYCGRHGRWMIGCIIGLAVLGVTFLFAVVSARRFSGHTRFTVQAAGLLSEISFLVFYAAASQRIYY